MLLYVTSYSFLSPFSFILLGNKHRNLTISQRNLDWYQKISGSMKKKKKSVCVFLAGLSLGSNLHVPLDVLSASGLVVHVATSPHRL